MTNNTGLLLLCEAELGQPMLQLVNADYNAGDRAKTEGRLATWGQGVTGPSKWKDAGCVHPALKGISMVRSMNLLKDTKVYGSNVHQPDISTKPGQTNVPQASLMYNEYIVYDIEQVRLRYLFRVNMAYNYA